MLRGSRACFGFVPALLLQESGFCFHQNVPLNSTSNTSDSSEPTRREVRPPVSAVWGPVCQISYPSAIFFQMKDSVCLHYGPRYGPFLRSAQDLHIGTKHCDLHSHLLQRGLGSLSMSPNPMAPPVVSHLHLPPHNFCAGYISISKCAKSPASVRALSNAVNSFPVISPSI